MLTSLAGMIELFQIKFNFKCCFKWVQFWNSKAKGDSKSNSFFIELISWDLTIGIIEANE